MKLLPDQADTLIEELDLQYPPRCIEPGESLDDHLIYAGKRLLIDELLTRQKAEQRKIKLERAS